MRAAGLRQIGRELLRRISQHDVSGIAAEMACRSLLELFPFFVFVAWLGDLLSGWLRVQNPARQILDLISDSVPRGAADPIRQQLEAVLQTREPGLVGLT